MGGVFEKLIDLIKDKTTSWGFKTALFITIIALVFISDYYLGFSYNYHLNNKIQQLEKLNSLKKDYENDSISTWEISRMEKKVINKKHYTERLNNLFLKDSTTSGMDLDRKDPNKDIVISTQKQKTIRSIFWMCLTSNYSLAIILPFLIFAPLYSKDGRKGNAIVGWFASMIVFGLVALITTWISFQIPLILDNPIWNYILNFIIHSIFLFLVIKWANKK